MNEIISLNLLYFIGIEIFLILLFSKLAFSLKLLDIPNERKIHQGSIPLVGGIVLFSFLFIYFIFFETLFIYKIIFTASLFIFFIGLYDDLKNMSIANRFFFQILSTLFVIGFGIYIHDLGYFEISSGYEILLDLGGFGIVLTLLSILGFTNAINFSDGIDGLASGYLVNCLLSLVLFSFYFGHSNNLEIIIYIIIALLVFMIANFGFFLPKIFLGDNGSTSLGFLTSCFLIYFTLPEVRYFPPLLVLWVAPIPVLDFLTIIVTRFIKGKSPFVGDRAHLHFLILNKVNSHKIVSLLLIISSMCLSLIGFLVFINLGAASSIGLFIFFSISYLLIYTYLRNN